jgi:hypothetical protein
MKDKKKDRDLVIVMALKSSTGAIILFHFSGNDTHGVEWSKQGHSQILKDDFATFASKVKWDGEFRFPLDKEGIAKLYEEREKKKEELLKEEKEAREKKDKKLAAEKRKELEKLEKQRLAEAQAAATARQQQQQQQSSSGGGVSGFLSTVSSVVGTMTSIGGDIASLF